MVEMDAMKSALASSQHAAADLAAAAIRHERALQEEKVRAAKASAEVPQEELFVEALLVAVVDCLLCAWLSMLSYCVTMSTVC